MLHGDAFQCLHRRDDGVAVRRIYASHGDIAQHLAAFDAHEVDGAENRARVADRAGDTRERPRPLRITHA